MISMLSNKFADLHIYTIDTIGANSAIDFAKRAFELGYKYVSFICFNKLRPSLIKEYKRICSDCGLDYIVRLDLEINDKNISKVKSFLRKFRRKIEVIVARPRSVQAARFSARDRRIDMIYFDEKSPKFDTIQAQLMHENDKFLELTFREILIPELRNNYLRIYHRIFQLVSKYKVKVIISSGARSIYEMRAPRDMAIAFNTIFNIKLERPYMLISDHPIHLISKNRRKLSKFFITEGVEVIGRSEGYEITRKILDFLS